MEAYFIHGGDFSRFPLELKGGRQKTEEGEEVAKGATQLFWVLGVERGGAARRNGASGSDLKRGFSLIIAGSARRKTGLSKKMVRTGKGSPRGTRIGSLRHQGELGLLGERVAR